MKKVLVIDGSAIFREFLIQKLEGFGLEVEQSEDGFEGLLKMQTFYPELLIIDSSIARIGALELLERKNANPNLKTVPVILVAGKVSKNELLEFSQRGVSKFLTKPLKLDNLFAVISELTGLRLEIDTSPCILEASCNDGILFIELSLGINKDKIEVLRFRLRELLDIYLLRNPGVLLIISGFEIGANDSLLFAVLLGTIIEHAKTRPEFIKILSSSTFPATFIAKREQFSAISVVTSLDQAMDELLGTKSARYLEDESASARAGFLPSAARTARTSGEGLTLRFKSEEHAVTSWRIAVVDDDLVLRSIVKKQLEARDMEVFEFVDGKYFLEAKNKADFDLIFLDLLMPLVDGFKVLQAIRSEGLSTPIIIMSALDNKETVLRAHSYSVNSYLIKPVSPELLLKKVGELLLARF